MTRLRLVASTATGTNLAELEPMAPERLPPGRHGLPADMVRTHQRQRLLEAAATALAEQGYGHLTAARVTELAGVSSRTFYQHFEDLWACLLAAYETEAGFLCARIEDVCSAFAQSDRTGRARAGIGAAIDFLASEPAVARLLSAEPPPQITALAAASGRCCAGSSSRAEPPRSPGSSGGWSAPLWRSSQRVPRRATRSACGSWSPSSASFCWRRCSRSAQAAYN
jgi:AcrR family transcriptional regulator